jgi:hypothetical protein
MDQMLRKIDQLGANGRCFLLVKRAGQAQQSRCQSKFENVAPGDRLMFAASA